MLVVGWLSLAMAVEPGAGNQELYRALSMRHPVPCEALEELSTAPVAELLWMIDNAQQPPWAPMRAGECLVRLHPDEVEEQVLRWVTEPALAGLGWQTLGLIDVLPVELSVQVAEAAVTGGPDLDRAKRLVEASSRPEVRAVLQRAPTGEVAP